LRETSKNAPFVKQHNKQSLSGHTSGVECVAFDRHEEVVAAGGHNGTVKLWDLGSGKGEGQRERERVCVRGV
jgi:WD40 repeat protein